MKPGYDRLTYLFHRYLQNDASDKELEELFDYIRRSEQQATLKEEIVNVFKHIQPEENFSQIDWDAIFLNIINRQEKKIIASKIRIRKIRVWRSVAAVVLLLILGGAGIYLFSNRASVSQQVQLAQAVPEKNDILPGGNKAVLTLANGTTIILDSAINGRLANQGNMNVVKINNGLLTYNSTKGKRQWAMGNGKPAQYNTLATPRGGQYRLTLSDGTNVWLNAASSIRYPVVFTGNERVVEITGEAYFEVVPLSPKGEPNVPFIVSVKSPSGQSMDVKVLGTHFNINAYADEPVIKTTLLEGSVKIKNIILNPGEQAVSNKDGKVDVRKNINVNDVISWKDGFFSFKNDNLKAVMRKISRWYDVDVVYRPGVNNEQQFSGRIDRSLTLSQILNGLKQTRAHFKIEENRKVVILP